MPNAAERIKLRRWALEMLVPTASIETDADIAHLCHAADVLIDFVLTGARPHTPAPAGDGQSMDGSPGDGAVPN